jgi:transcriptional regulator with XRE-family HTH domain
MNNIGREIKELREYLGLSQGQLAKLSGLTTAAISQIEGEKREPSLSSIEKICDALEIEPAYLFRDKTKKRSPLEVIEHSKLSDHYKKEIEKFAQYLAFSKGIREVTNE